MKVLSIVVLGLLNGLPAVAQTTEPVAAASAATSQSSPTITEAPDITVGRINWRKDVYIPALYDDPMNPNQEQADLKREQRAIKKANAIKVQGGQAPLPMPTREVYSSGKEPPAGPEVNYLYEATVKNTSAKSIKALVWEYRVYDAQTNVEVGRHRFSDTSKIRAGKSANLIAYSSTPAVSVVSVPRSGKEWREHYAERVVISRIEYEDGTFWQRPISEP
jgi:hypothetical protein